MIKVRALWFSLVFAVLGISMLGFEGEGNSDIADFLVISMLALSFPSGFIVVVALSSLSILIYESFGYSIPVSYQYIFIVWLCFFAVGYIQWFKLMGWLRKWW